MKANAVIGYGGGPTCVINETAIEAGKVFSNDPNVDNVWIMHNGIDSIRTREFYDFKKETPVNLEKIARTVSAAGGSTRTKPSKIKGLFEETFELFERNNIRYFIYIGGNDTALAVYEINEHAKNHGYPISCVHAVKTIDNDVVLNHHCTGFPSAAVYVVLTTFGAGKEAESIPGIIIDVGMGRKAGFLVGSSILAKQSENDAPHLIYMPERPVSGVKEIIDDIKEVYSGLGRCCITLSEGATVSLNGKEEPLLDSLMDYLRPRGIELKIAEHLIGDIFKKDNFGNTELSSYSFLGDFLSMALKLEPEFKNTRIRAQTLGYNPRCFDLIKDEKDVLEAKKVGKEAAKYALSELDNDGSIALTGELDDSGLSKTTVVPLKDVADKTRLMPDEFIGEDGKSVTPEYKDYLSSLIWKKIPEIGRFNNMIRLK
jgi:ATP-dependent phosphofructokinase / diphosphate-dependent phosphofructokinase